MTTFVRRTIAIAALIIVTLITGILTTPPVPSAADGGGTILWKQNCPWRAEIQVRQDGNDLIVFCLQYR